jgi:hypothetical protein
MTPQERIAARIKEMRDQGEHSIALLDAVDKLVNAHNLHISNCHSGLYYSERALEEVADLLAPEGKHD